MKDGPAQEEILAAIKSHKLMNANLMKRQESYVSNLQNIADIALGLSFSNSVLRYFHCSEISLDLYRASSQGRNGLGRLHF